MTPQEVFDTIVNHLRKQGSKSLLTVKQNDALHISFTSPNGACAYRSLDGKKCAAGVMIADEEYSPTMEGISISGVLNRDNCPHSLKDKIGPHIYLVRRLQMIHDENDVDSWERGFERLANQYHLTYAAPDATNGPAPTDTSG